MNKKIFIAEMLHKLNNPERLNWLPPEEIWKFMELQNPRVLVDFGAGTGLITARLSQFAPQADIHALDIQPEMVEYLTTHMPDTVTPMLIKGNTIPLADCTVDALWNIAVYHELEDRDFFLSEVFRILKPGGKLLVIDWEKESPLLTTGPPLEDRVPVANVIEEIRDCGFIDIRTMLSFKSHIAVCGKKPL